MFVRVHILALALAFLAACAAPTVDAFAPAAHELEQGRLLKALVGLDRVPPAHPRYAEARTLAVALERRMRVAQELVLRGLRLRSEWRDQAAIELFQRAQTVWPEVPGGEEFLLATKNRIAALSAGVERQVLPEVLTREPESASVPSAPALEIVAELSVQQLLERGDLDEAIEKLEALQAKLGDQGARREVLIGALNQRALNRYGLAFLEPALADWGRVLSLDPRHLQARMFSTAARTELEDRRRPD